MPRVPLGIESGVGKLDRLPRRRGSRKVVAAIEGLEWTGKGESGVGGTGREL